MRNTGGKKLVGKGATVGSSVGMEDPDYDNERNGLKLRYSIPIWFNSCMIILILFFAAGAFATIIFHHRHDADAYVCNDDDEDRWFCPAIFEPNSDDCAALPYKDWATGGSFQTCFYDICVYFKDWAPVIPFVCIGGETFPQTGKQHCLDFIDDDYEKKDRLEVILFCSGSDAVCIYRDKCSQYNVIDTDSEPDADAASTKSSAISALDQLKILNGTNFYIYGSQQALKKTSSK